MLQREGREEGFRGSGPVKRDEEAGLLRGKRTLRCGASTRLATPHGALEGLSPDGPAASRARTSWPLYSPRIRWIPAPDSVNKSPRCPIKLQLKNEYFKKMSLSPVLQGRYLHV